MSEAVQQAWAVLGAKMAEAPDAEMASALLQIARAALNDLNSIAKSLACLACKTD